MRKDEQLKLLKFGLNLKDVFLLQFLQEAPKALNLKPIEMDNNVYYELTIIQLLDELPMLEVKERQLFNMMKKLSDVGLILKQKSKYGFIFSPAKNCITAIESCKKLHNWSSSPAKNCITEPQNEALDYIYTLDSNINNNINLSNNGGEGISRSDKYNINIPLCDKNELLKKVRLEFQAKYPDKSIFYNGELPENFNPDLLLIKIADSYDFLAKESKFNLSWCIKNYEAIIAGQYDTFEGKKKEEPKQDFNQREYSQEQLNYLFNDLNDVEIGG